MPRTLTAPRLTLAQAMARIAELEAAPVKASSHWDTRDLPCPIKGADCKRKDGTIRTFRTEGGQVSHIANLHTPKA